MSRTRRRGRESDGRRRRGAALMEFCFILPLLMIILLLIVFMAHSMSRKQEVIVADRHFAWRQARQLDPPTRADGQTNYAAIRELHFNGEPVAMSMSGGGRTPDDAQRGLVEAARRQSAEAGRFADDVVNTRFPGDVGFRTEVTYPPDTLPLDRFGRDIADRHYRQGVSWQRSQTAIWREVRDHYIADFDSQVTSRGSNGLTDVIRNLYLRRW